jgi:hypothetical protein
VPTVQSMKTPPRSGARNASTSRVNHRFVNRHRIRVPGPTAPARLRP